MALSTPQLLRIQGQVSLDLMLSSAKSKLSSQKRGKRLVIMLNAKPTEIHGCHKVTFDAIVLLGLVDEDYREGDRWWATGWKIRTDRAHMQLTETSSRTYYSLQCK